MLAGRRVVLGVSGGVASYKSCFLARRLVEAGANVQVVLTRGAAQFVGPVTFEALTGHPVLSSLWERGQALDHIRVPQHVELMIVAPATAHLIARLANGLADDLLTTMMVAGTAPILLAPAMNDEMFAHPATRTNLEILRSRDVTVVGPVVGPLAEGPSERPGRMSEPEAIFDVAVRLLRRGGPLRGRRVLVTAGPTREAIDPVRFLSNRSSGKMGYRVAQAAWWRGAEVVLVSGPSAERVPDGVQLVPVETTAELEDAVERELAQADVLIMAAAPADYRPTNASARKRPRAAGDLTLALEPTTDILAATAGVRRPGAIMVGFALETGDALARGLAKLEQKDLDLIVINDALEPGAGFEVDTNKVTIVGRGGEPRTMPLLSKAEVAEAILDSVEHAIVAQAPVSGAAD